MHKTCLQYEVPYADTDQMGVIYYANYLIFFERARTRLLDELGFMRKLTIKRPPATAI